MGTTDTATRSGTWWARSLAALAGAVLGMAVGHGLAWQTVDPLPDDAQAQQLAARFVPGESGEVTRTLGVWRAEPSGWLGVLIGHRELRPGQVSVKFPVATDDPVAQRPHVEQVAEALRSEGWRVMADPMYPALRATRDGLWVNYGGVYGELDPARPEDPQVMEGVAVTIRHATPAGAGIGLLLGALVGGAVAVVTVTGMQRLLRRRSARIRRRVVVLASVGLGLLAPGTLLTLGTLYLFVTEDLPQEPLWIGYSLPLTRPPALLAAALLLTAVALTAAPARTVRASE